jgi:Cytotoxic translational repressor of toxin-antitoxin stability system
MPRATARRFITAIDFLATGQSSGLDIKKLAGREGYRLRIGGWRALYRMEEEQLIIEVVKIGPRGDIYK